MVLGALRMLSDGGILQILFSVLVQLEARRPTARPRDNPLFPLGPRFRQEFRLLSGLRRGVGADMASITVEKFLECVAKSELVAKDQLSQTVASLKQSDPDAVADADRLAEKLIQANLLTRWQCDNLLQGKSSGFMLGPFKLLRLLGAGGMSTVYLGEHTLMQCLRAIKVLPAGRVEDSSYLERFRQEAIAAARLNHPNIVQAFDIGQHKKHHYIVMEYVEGKDLQNLVKDQGPLDYDMAANYIRQAAEGLGYAHSKHLIHRDIKPANLLVDGKGVVKLLKDPEKLSADTSSRCKQPVAHHRAR